MARPTGSMLQSWCSIAPMAPAFRVALLFALAACRIDTEIEVATITDAVVDTDEGAAGESDAGTSGTSGQSDGTGGPSGESDGTGSTTDDGDGTASTGEAADLPSAPVAAPDPSKTGR